MAKSFLYSWSLWSLPTLRKCFILGSSWMLRYPICRPRSRRKASLYRNCRGEEQWGGGSRVPPFPPGPALRILSRKCNSGSREPLWIQVGLGSSVSFSYVALGLSELWFHHLIKWVHEPPPHRILRGFSETGLSFMSGTGSRPPSGRCRYCFGNNPTAKKCTHSISSHSSFDSFQLSGTQPKAPQTMYSEKRD